MKKTLSIGLLLSLMATASFADAYSKCMGCHGANGEKKALGKSAIIKGWEIEKTVAALKGYKTGTYGGAMKGLMKGQVASMSDEQINAIAKYLAK